MRKTLNEYGRILIISAIMVFVIAYIFGGKWTNYIGKIAETNNPDAAISMELNRQAPTINASNHKVAVGQSWDATKWATAFDADNKDISKYIQIKGTSRYYDGDNKIFKSTKEGLYKLTFTVKDPKNESLTCSKTITVMVDASIKKTPYEITVINSDEGVVSLSTSLAYEGDAIQIIAVSTQYKIGSNLEIELSNGSSQIIQLTQDTSTDGYKGIATFEMPNCNVIIHPHWMLNQ